MLERDGNEFILAVLTDYVSGDASVVWEMLQHPCTILGLGDGGAHVTRICDALVPTFMLTHWARDRKRGPKLPLERVVRKISSQGAAFFGLNDRGVLAPGKKADINVIDFEQLHLHVPEMVYDQPAGARRLVQRADGYHGGDDRLLGVPIFEGAARATGEMPGSVISVANHVKERPWKAKHLLCYNVEKIHRL